MKNTVKVNYFNMMSDSIGDRGISKQEITQMQQHALKCFDEVQAKRGLGWQGWMDLPTKQKDVVQDVLETANYIRSNFKYFVVLGIGGSALGPIAMFNACKHLYYNELSDDKRNGPKFYVIDNVDSERMNALLDIIDTNQTMFNVVTKSGATSETMSQYLIISDILTKKLGKNANKHIIATTDAKKGNLIKLAKLENYKTFIIPDGVGGRFSQFCPVGLLPAAVLGIDINEFLNGADLMDKRCNVRDIYANPALMLAILSKISMDKGYNINIVMPYADSLKYIADWFCQLWGESLGKAVDNDGKQVNVGQTPVKSLGVTDQHSQVQLYTEGPFDKVTTFIAVENFRSDITIPKGCEQFGDVNFLCGHTLSELLTKELYATMHALTQANRANYCISLSQVNANTLGQLMYLFMMQTAFTGQMLNIDAYNQSGVEEGKNATYALFGRKGYEAKLAQMNSVAVSDKYII